MVGNHTTLEYICCANCGSVETKIYSQTKDYISGETFTVVRCVGCGLIYVNPRPLAGELARYYPQIHQSSEPAHYERMDARPRIKLVSGLLPSRPGQVLDVGCGKGLLLLGLREAGWDVCGVELSEVSARYAQAAGITVHTRPVEDCPFEPNSFDVITLFHSLEHLTEPLQALEVIHSLLRSDGFLVVEVPNIGSWYARSFGDAWFHFDVPRHLYHFNRQTLRRVLETAGFRVIHESTHNLQYDAFGAVQSLLNKFIAEQNLLNNFNTGEVTATELWRSGGIRGLGALAISEIFLGVGFPLLALASIGLAPWVEGGTLRFVARLR